MSEKRIAENDLQKALQTLQDLAKGAAGGDTATTKVPAMVGESGSPQLFHTASNSDPGGWAGSTWKGESWDDMVAANGTDVGAMTKMAKSILDKMSKGQTLSGHEVAFVSKGGMNFLDKAKVDKAFPPKKDDDDKDMDKGYGADKEKMMEKAQHEDEEEDKKMVKEMVKPDAMKKSFMDHASDTPAMQAGLEVSEFLAGFAQVMHKSLQSMEARITDRVLTGLSRNAEEQGTVQKSLAEALAALGEAISVQAQRIDQVESAPARGPKSEVRKSLDGAPESGNLSKSQISDKLFDLLQKGMVTQNDVLKFDATGELSPDLARKVVGR
ncbi:hypothetical protein HC928_00335 [bacterium]|nr:hypothetical protein [bacterium]